MAVRDVPMSGTADPPEDAATASTNVSKATDGGAKDGPPKPKMKKGFTEEELEKLKMMVSAYQPPPASDDAPVDPALAAKGYELAGMSAADAAAKAATAAPPEPVAPSSAPPEKTPVLAKTPGAPSQPASTKKTPTAPAKAAAASKPAAPASSPAAPTPSGWLPEGVVRNLSILWGACLGAAYEVATMPTTVQNFNKAVYAATGMLGEYLPRNYDRALGAVDYYAMVLDVVSALVFFALNVGVALAAVLVTVRVIKIFTGYGESALNFVCIPFTWSYAVRAVKELDAQFNWRVPPLRAYGAALGATVVVVEIFESVAPVMTRGVCLGVAFSFFATELLQFASGFVWIIGLLFATWTARFVLRLALKLASRVFPPAEQVRAAMPKIALVPGMKKAAAAMGVGAQAGALMAGKGAKVAARAAKGGAKIAGRTARAGSAGAGVVGGAGAAAAAAGARAGAAVGAAAAKGTVYGIVQGVKGGARAGLAAGDLVVKGTMTAGRVAAAAPLYAWRSAGKIRSFVHLATVRAEATFDPVAPKTRTVIKKTGGLQPRKDKLEQARRTQKLRI